MARARRGHPQRPRQSRSLAAAASNDCTLIRGHARFEAPDTLRVGDELLIAPRIFINVGGRAAVPDMPGVGDVPFLTNTLAARARASCPGT